MASPLPNGAEPVGRHAAVTLMATIGTSFVAAALATVMNGMPAPLVA